MFLASGHLHIHGIFRNELPNTPTPSSSSDSVISDQTVNKHLLNVSSCSGTACSIQDELWHAEVEDFHRTFH